MTDTALAPEWRAALVSSSRAIESSSSSSRPTAAGSRSIDISNPPWRAA